MLFRIQAYVPDYQSEGVQIVSNIDDGFGILGALNPYRIIIPF